MKLSKDMKKQIADILKKRNVSHASVFGSFARGDANENSDIDILVEPSEKNLFELAAIKNDLEENLNKRIDLVTYNVLNYPENKDIKRKIDEEQVVII
ncbi:MAG: nucleotidyltransferase family protein, partial [bacterium]